MIWDPATNVIIGHELKTWTRPDGVVEGFRTVRLVTAAGHAWDKNFLPFNLNINSVVLDWNLKQLDTWTLAK